MKSVTMALAALAFGVAGAAFAQSSGPPPGGPGGAPRDPAFAAMREACKADADKFCAGKERGERRQCMMDHEKDLSQGCKDARAKLPPPSAGGWGGGPPKTP